MWASLELEKKTKKSSAGIIHNSIQQIWTKYPPPPPQKKAKSCARFVASYATQPGNEVGLFYSSRVHARHARLRISPNSTSCVTKPRDTLSSPWMHFCTGKSRDVLCRVCRTARRDTQARQAQDVRHVPCVYVSCVLRRSATVESGLYSRWEKIAPEYITQLNSMTSAVQYADVIKSIFMPLAGIDQWLWLVGWRHAYRFST